MVFSFLWASRRIMQLIGREEGNYFPFWQSLLSLVLTEGFLPWKGWSHLSPAAPRMASKISSNWPAQPFPPLDAFQMYSIRTTIPRIPWMSSEVIPCIFSGVYHHENVQKIFFLAVWVCQGFSKFTTAASELVKLLMWQLNLLEFAKEPMANFLRTRS